MSLRLKQKATWYRRLTALATTALLMSFAIPGVASAHVLKLDSTIAGILHVNPDDDTPVAGKATNYIMEFDDDTGRFTLPKCNCTVSVINDNTHKVVATEPLAVTSNKASNNYYTFPQSGIYNLRFTGTPKEAGAFQPFTLVYTETVIAGVTNSQSLSPYLWAGMSAAVIAVITAGYITNRGRRSPTNE